MKILKDGKTITKQFECPNCWTQFTFMLSDVKEKPKHTMTFRGTVQYVECPICHEQITISTKYVEAI
jgi:predicted RNA-binding Zn-ribbon protein involved in translation (DUF1610 family)